MLSQIEIEGARLRPRAAAFGRGSAYGMAVACRPGQRLTPGLKEINIFLP